MISNQDNTAWDSDEKEILRETPRSRFTSTTKVIDNSTVGFVRTSLKAEVE